MVFMRTRRLADRMVYEICEEDETLWYREVLFGKRESGDPLFTEAAKEQERMANKLMGAIEAEEWPNDE